MRGAALQPRRHTQKLKISTHAPHARRGDVRSPYKWSRAYFYSRASCEARRAQVQDPTKDTYNFYSRASCEARLTVAVDRPVKDNFYSRASCEARLSPSQENPIFETPISTHAPHARRGGPITMLSFLAYTLFLLTRLMRGAATFYSDRFESFYISTHAPHARRGPEVCSLEVCSPISTHAPHARRGVFRRTY